ncbi:glycosyltransferase family 2 protein, partial [Staphylococcus devriesei]|uniref:glycosyltransferase family 2 protein n=2 Tax=Staphylococcus devriesei TaxID=586733 RepID=UPI0021750B6B
MVNQTLNNDKYEIIVIDDQSTDGTMEILSAYNESNLKIYQLDENSGGPSQPRNKGIRESNGDYIYFLDGDDWLDLNVLETISLNYLHLDSDIIISKVIKDNDGKQSIHAKFMTIKENYNVNGNDIPYLYYYLGPSGKFIKRELIFKNNISFPHNLHFGEDKIFFMNVFSLANSVTTISAISTYINS